MFGYTIALIVINKLKIMNFKSHASPHYR